MTSHETEPDTHGPNTPAAQAFRKHYADLAAAISDPLPIAASLYSSSYITKETRDRVALPIHTQSEKNFVLLDAVEKKIFAASSNFWTLVAALEAESSLRILAERLRNTYGQVCVGIPSVPIPCSPEIARFADYLRAYYRTARIAPDDKLRLKGIKTYIHLATVSKEETTAAEADEFTRATLHGQIDQIYRKKQPVSFEDVLKPAEGQERVDYVLVEGAPGVGKSTFAWEQCRKWDEIEAMKSFSLVVLLRFREKRIQKASTLAELFYYLFDPSLQQAVAAEIKARQGAQTLLILDGFDEATESIGKNPFLVSILQRVWLPKLTLIVTSRPSARAQFMELCMPHVSKHIEVLGFLEDQIHQYADVAFGDKPSLHADFLKYVACNPLIKSLMYIPLNCAIVTEVYRANKTTGNPIPRTLTQLYTELTLALLRRHQTRGGQPVRDLHALPQDLHVQLSSLTKLAFLGILEQTVIFPSLPDGCSHLDLMNASTELYVGDDGAVSCSFLHLTLQEFLAALHISLLSHDEQKQLFELYSSVEEYSRFDNVWRFLAGLTGFGSIGWEEVVAKRGRDIKCRALPFLVECLFETQDVAVCQKVLGEKVQFWGYGECSLFDYFAVGHIISSSKCSWNVTLANNPHGPEGIEMLVSGIKSREEVRGSITRLNLDNNYIKEEGITHLKEMPSEILRQLPELSMQCSDLDTAALDSFSNIILTMTSLKTLYIGFNRKPEPGGAVQLLRKLAKHSVLQMLAMVGISIGLEDIQALSELIGPTSCAHLKELRIGGLDSHIGAVGASVLARALKSNNSLEKLYINSDETMGKTGAHALVNALEHNCTLIWLQLPRHYSRYFSSVDLDPRVLWGW